MRRVVVLALLALALPIAASAGIIVTNNNGSISISPCCGAGSIITSTGSHLHSWGAIVAAPNHDLGSVSFSTGAFLGSTLFANGTFSPTGSSFVVIGVGSWAKTLTGLSSPVTLFTGSFTGPITWTVAPHVPGGGWKFQLSGAITGVLWNGRTVNGTTVQNLYSSTGQLNQGIGHIKMGTTNLSTPEPGTLGLLGTGLVGIAGMFRRKLTGA